MNRENEYNHEKFFNYSLDLHAIQRMDGVILQINQSFQRVMGWTNEDLQGRTHFHLLHPDDVESSLKEFEQLNEGVSHLSIENRCRCSDGTYKYFSWTAFPDMESGRIYVTGRDITELVETNLKVNQLAADLKEANDQLLEQAYSDPLTRLKNRRAFNENMNCIVHQSLIKGHPLSLLMIDVDYFKDYNDQFGHPAGDQVLIDLSSLLTQTLRQHDVIARYGGEEFIVAMPNTSEATAMQIAEGLLQIIREFPWKRRSVTISIGVSTLSGNQKSQIENNVHLMNLIESADRALYHSKVTGKDRATHSSRIVSESQSL
ncbi:diguanylate cyclase [Leptospira yasudae]|uniref:diguanylate cyclase n=1 Tax=Leptospira yasudae TaxID=2202201 RepID=A0ABX9LY93_9LEPT|nr:sensor domain-containing diguanylate cyclase [Leptospira yasudae]RHX77815.1 diguanylate cyclase [Leptospira yasudae]RHX90329.1 diguanylate cyclase [Leptospira yasudae]